MRNLSELSITAWLIFGMLLIFVPICLIFHTGPTHPFAFFIHFTFLDYVICSVLGLVSVLSQTTRAQAVQHEEPARLSVLNYFQPVIQLMTDLLIWDTEFTLQQMLGVIIIFGANSIRWVSNIYKLFIKNRRKAIR